MELTMFGTICTNLNPGKQLERLQFPKVKANCKLHKIAVLVYCCSPAYEILLQAVFP
jgi:hypothetical protein